jgi:hypothetical protein
MATLSGPYRMKGLAALRAASDVIVNHNHSLSHVPRVDFGSRAFTPTRRDDLIGQAAGVPSRDRSSDAIGSKAWRASRTMKQYAGGTSGGARLRDVRPGERHQPPSITNPLRFLRLQQTVLTFPILNDKRSGVCTVKSVACHHRAVMTQNRPATPHSRIHPYRSEF